MGSGRSAEALEVVAILEKKTRLSSPLVEGGGWTGVDYAVPELGDSGGLW
jgi:hypothetical protein